MRPRWLPALRHLHSAVPKDVVKNAIRSCIQASIKTPVEHIKFGADAALDTKIIIAASCAASTPIPDNALSSFSTCSDLINYLCEPRKPPSVKGIPKLELFGGEEMPPNVTLINHLELEKVLSGTAETLTALLGLESKRQDAVQREFQNSSDMNKALDSFVRVEIALSNLYGERGQVVKSIQTLDKAIITAGPQLPLLEKIASLESVSFNKLKEYNSGWSLTLGPQNFVKPDVKFPRSKAIESIFKPSIDLFTTAIDRPLVLKETIDHWPALSEWQSLDFFVQNFGHRLVPVEIGGTYLDDNWSQKLVPFGEFLQNSSSGTPNQTMYLAQHDLFSQIPRLRQYINLPKHIPQKADQIFRNIWIGAAGTKTPFHHDPYDNFFCQVIGYKTFYLIDPNYTNLIPSVSGNTSALDLDSGDAQNLEFAIQEMLLSPGDILFIPKGWWHCVIGQTFNISVSFWF